jgi:hypothetical protein
VSSINTARKTAAKSVDEKIAAAIESTNKTTKSTPAKSIDPKIETLASELASIEGAILAAGLTERALADDPMGKKRNELIVKLIKLGAGYGFIAKTRNVAPSTNRGLCRVLEGGKRI